MTTGQKLKTELGLDSYRNVWVSFVVGSSPAIYVVMYDSLRPNMPVSKQYLQKYSNVVFYKKGKELMISSPFEIERTNSNYGTGTVVTYDLAMSGRTKRESLEIDIDRLTETKLEKKFVGRLEELTLDDLANSGKSAISDRTFLWFQDRNKNGFTASKSFKLIDCVVSEGDNSFTFFFLTESTEGEIKTKDLLDSDYDYDDPKGEVDPKSWNIKNNPSKTYEVQIKFTDLQEFVDYINTKPEGSKVKKEDIDYLIRTMDVQYFSSSPSFNWQGYAAISTELGLSIYPQEIQSKQWMPKTFGGEYFLDKHLYSFVRSYKFFAQQMASMIGKKLKDRNLI